MARPLLREFESARARTCCCVRLHTSNRPTIEPVKEFDDFTLRANISPTEFLPETMARAYAITAAPNLVLLNLVVLEKRSDGQAVPVSAALSAHYENLVGQVKVIDMRVVEANGNVSYIGTLDASAERVFRLVIEAQPAGTNQPLQVNFDVQLDKLDIR